MLLRPVSSKLDPVNDGSKVPASSGEHEAPQIKGDRTPESGEGGNSSSVRGPDARGVPTRRSAVIGSAAFSLGCVLAFLLQQSSLLVIPQLPFLTSGLACPAESRGQPRRHCQRLTKSGLCIEDFFDAVDDVYHDMWPGSVDLLLRTYVSDKIFLMETLFKSIDQMWPKNIGDVVLVFDVGDEEVMSLVPSWTKVFFEENYLKLEGKVLQQWSYGWADLYTTADFVAIMDDDVIFNMKVTPAVLFNLTEGRPYVIGSRRHQMFVFTQWTEFLVGKGKYSANFMVQLPFLMPRSVFPAFRDHVGKIYGNTYDKAFKWFTEAAKEFGKDQIQHCALGNYMYHYQRDKAHFALEWTDHIPIPRVGVHIPYSLEFFKRLPEKKVRHRMVKQGVPKVDDLYGAVCSLYALEGLCHSLPKGEIEGCDNMKEVLPQVWMYAYDWMDWPLIYKNIGPALYDQHIKELHCMFRRYRNFTASGLFHKSSVKRRAVVDFLKVCIPRSHRGPQGLLM